MPLKEALEIAYREDLDLVEVAPNADPPVCRIMDYGKYKYQASKKSQMARKKSKTFQVKEIRVRPHTDKHDLDVKIKKIKEFLERKDRVKITVMFRGREKAYMDSGLDILERIAEEIKEMGTIDKPPTKEGWRLTMVIAPK